MDTCWKKTEREKMLAGELYWAYDQELMALREKSRTYQQEYNHNVAYDDVERKTATLKKWFGSVGEGPIVEAPFRCDYGINIHVGDHFYANYDCCILDCARVEIGSHVLLAPSVHIYTATHPFDPVVRRTLECAKPVKIGNDVWIGGRAIILPGISIGDNSVIGAGSVVTKDIPTNVVAAGNPCRIIKTIGEERGKEGGFEAGETSALN